jgi:hypothetical protein
VSLADELIALEVSTLEPPGRYSRETLERLLTDDFCEHGASGAIYDRAAIIDMLMQEAASDRAPINASDFAVDQPAPDIALVHYRTDRAGRVCLRSSHWRREASGWRMFFHHATLTNQGSGS